MIQLIVSNSIQLHNLFLYFISNHNIRLRFYKFRQMQRYISPFSYDQICFPIFYPTLTFHYDSRLNYYRCSREEELDEKIARVSRVSRAIRFRRCGWCCIFLRWLHASIHERTADRDTITKHFHGGGLSRRLSWDLRGSVGYRLRQSDLVFDANECLSMYVCPELGTVRFTYFWISIYIKWAINVILSEMSVWIEFLYRLIKRMANSIEILIIKLNCREILKYLSENPTFYKLRKTLN